MFGDIFGRCVYGVVELLWKVKIFVQKDQLCFSESRFETLAIHTGLCNQNVSKVCHIYGIRENELRKFAGLPTVSTSGKERERRIYFAGPWIKPDECPKENMDIWFTDGGSYDYFLTPSDVNGFDKLFGKHAEKKTYTSKKQHTLRSWCYPSLSIWRRRIFILSNHNLISRLFTVAARK